MIFAKYVRSNQPFGLEEEGLTRGFVYAVKRIDKERQRVCLEGFEDNTYNIKCFEFYKGTKIKI